MTRKIQQQHFYKKNKILSIWFRIYWFYWTVRAIDIRKFSRRIQFQKMSICRIARKCNVSRNRNAEAHHFYPFTSTFFISRRKKIHIVVVIFFRPAFCILINLEDWQNKISPFHVFRKVKVVESNNLEKYDWKLHHDNLYIFIWKFSCLSVATNIALWVTSTSKHTRDEHSIN